MKIPFILLVTVAIVSATTAGNSHFSVPGALLGCVNQVAHATASSHRDFQSICAKRDQVLKCLVDNCAFGNFLQARDHYLGTCLCMVSELQNNTRYTFFKQPHENDPKTIARGSTADYWKAESMARKVAIKEYNQSRKYSNATITPAIKPPKNELREHQIQNNEHNKDINDTTTILASSRKIRQKDAIPLEEKTFDEVSEFRQFAPKKVENYYDDFTTITTERVLSTPLPVQDVHLASTNIALSLKFDKELLQEQTEKQLDDFDDDSDSPENSENNDDLDDLFGGTKISNDNRRRRRRKKGHERKIKGRKKKVYKADRERKWRAKDRNKWEKAKSFFTGYEDIGEKEEEE
ncbi:hypothetical protein FOA43_003488 [Brettanomyces nanus]|uniref:Uncharacterized protein n=1 Tax=Eeniella nana TaxID=13502 RepID=A0A875S866_EENNA|nr:uncharacterized protein FOA43_003488 [Brettanomyces nanus]QPG76102.1 hypothetical protein FOA43_003488 [Brettanomyces nanus]